MEDMTLEIPRSIKMKKPNVDIWIITRWYAGNPHYQMSSAVNCEKEARSFANKLIAQGDPSLVGVDISKVEKTWTKPLKRKSFTDLT